MKRKNRFMKQFLAMFLTAAMIAGQSGLPAYAEEMPMQAVEQPVVAEEGSVSQPGTEQPSGTEENLTPEPGAEQPAGTGEDTVSQPAAEQSAESEEPAVTAEAEESAVSENISEPEEIPEPAEAAEPGAEQNAGGVTEDGYILVTSWNGLQNEFNNAGSTASSAAKIRLAGNVTCGESDTYLTVERYKYVTLDLNGYILDRGRPSNIIYGSVMIVEGNLTLEDSSDNRETPDYDGAGVITGGNEANGGGGVYVASGGHFTMDSGSISGNTSQSEGGVYVGDNASFTMNGGSISGNTSRSGGGVYVGGNNSSFTMTGGSITGNSSTIGDGGGVYVDSNGHFTMKSGSISGNTSQSGGGVYINGASFTMEKGSITDNSSTNGGGVYVADNASFTMDGGSISGNAVDTANPYSGGGGVYVADNASFTMNGGSVCGNTVSGNNNNCGGGGVFVAGGSFTMTKGSISGNNVSENGENCGGGGVDVEESGIFTMTGGSVAGNNVSGDTAEGGGVYGCEEILISGTPVIRNNVRGGVLNNGVYTGGTANNVGLANNAFITVTGEINEGAEIRVSSSKSEIIAKGGNIATAYTITADDAKRFHADDPEKIVKKDENYIKLVSAWATLQDKLNEAASGAVITLDRDYAAPREERASLIIGEGKSIILDLAGHTIDRKASSPGQVGEGNAILVSGNLTLMDSSDNPNTPEYDGTGAITGGNSNGGGVYVLGTFTMKGGSISGNSAVTGGGVYVDRNGTFTMEGGSITGNSASNGGGVYVHENGTFTMTGGSISGNSGDYGGGVFICEYTNDFKISGKPFIFNNNNNNSGAPDNVFLNKLITIEGTLRPGAKIGISEMREGSTLAKLGKGYNITPSDAACFFSDRDPDVVGTLTDDCELKISLKKKTTWSELKTQFANATGTSESPTKIWMNQDAVAGISDNALTVPDGKHVKLELNGFKIDRGLAGKEPVENGYVIKVGPSASLTVSDSSESQKGTITGGNNTDSGGGVCMDQTPGEFNLTGGSIKGNKAKYGGGVFVTSGQCNISGTARIEGNSCFDMDGDVGLGGGVVVYTGRLSLRGNPVIQNNVRNGTWDSTQGVYTSISNNNLYLSNGNGTSQRKIELSAPLTSGASIGVTLDELRKFTDNWNSIMGSANPAGYFTSDDPDYTVVLQDGEAALVSHSHHFTYTSDGATITATCSNSDGKCPLDGYKASLTITAPLLTVYDERDEYGKIKDPEAHITDKNNIRDGAEISYYKADANGNRSGAPLKDAPKNAGRYRAEITLGSGSNSATAFVVYEIEKAVPVYIKPTSLKAVYGQTLKNVILPVSENGVWTWADESASVGNAGTNTFRAVYTPEDTENYKIVEEEVSVEVAKAEYQKTSLSANQRFGTTGMIELKDNIPEEGAAGNITSIAGDTEVLSGNAAVTDNVLSCTLKDNREYVGKSVRFTIPVTSCKNYLDYELTVTLTVADCSHTRTELRHVLKATCMATGYSGDLCCADCNALIKAGEETPIDPDNHDFDMEHGEVTTKPTYLSYGARTYKCKRNEEHTLVLWDVEPLPSPDGENYEDLAEDTRGISGNDIITGTDESGNSTETIKVGGEEVSKTITDKDTGKETVVSKVWVGGLKDSYIYTGSAIKPSFHVYDGTKKLTEKSDYTAGFKNNKDAGTATITVKFKGNYGNTKQETVKFEIKPAVLGVDIIAHETGAAVKKSAQKPVPMLTWAKSGKTVAAKNFSVSYDPSTVKAAGTYTATITPKKAGGNFDGKTTALIKVAEKNKVLSNAKVKFDRKSYDYNGTAVEPKYTLTLGGKTLTENTDYRKVSVTGNTEPGIATIIFEAISGNSTGYVGSKTATFKISGKKELKEGESFTFDFEESVPYAKGGAKAAVSVRDNDSETTLKEGKDYTVSYSKNKAVTNGATAELKIKGKGSYKGTVTKTFAITKQSLKALSENIVIADQFTSKSKLKKPSVTITDIDGKKLKADKDFAAGTDYVYTGDDANGTVTFTITGKGNYKEDEPVRVTFRYMQTVSSNLGKAKKMKDIPAQDYTGNAVKLVNADLKEILYTGSKSSPVYLVPGKDYKIEGYSNNVKKGTAKVTLKGMNGLAGTKTLTFKIREKKVNYKGALVGGNWK